MKGGNALKQETPLGTKGQAQCKAGAIPPTFPGYLHKKEPVDSNFLDPNDRLV